MRPCPSSFRYNRSRVRSKVPSRRQRVSRSWAVVNLPYRSGSSRHRAPVQGSRTTNY